MQRALTGQTSRSEREIIHHRRGRPPMCPVSRSPVLWSNVDRSLVAGKKVTRFVLCLAAAGMLNMQWLMGGVFYLYLTSSHSWKRLHFRKLYSRFGKMCFNWVL